MVKKVISPAFTTLLKTSRYTSRNAAETRIYQKVSRSAGFKGTRSKFSLKPCNTKKNGSRKTNNTYRGKNSSFIIF